MLIHIYVSDPVRLTLVIPIKIGRQDGRFGTVLTTTVPKLQAGRLDRRAEAEDRPPFSVGGERRSYLSAACAARRLPRRRLPLRPRRLQLLQRAQHAHRPRRLQGSKVGSGGDVVPQRNHEGEKP